MAPKKKESEPKKKEFGTGLRAQLERRREDEAAPAPDAQPNVELRFELTARPADSSVEPIAVATDGIAAELRKELAASQLREEKLKAELAQQAEVFQAGMDSEQNVARRAAALDDREAKLAEFEVELEERERKIRDQRQTIEAEHSRMAELQAELAADQATSAEQKEAAERKLRELKSFDRDRSKFAAELEKQRNALADREKKLARSEQELEARERAGAV